MSQNNFTDRYEIVADLHCHTVASTHAYSTVTENASGAALAGLKAIAITDHAPAMPDSPHRWHFYNLKALPKRINGVRILHGIEANVMNSRGEIDVPKDILERLHVVVASMHSDVIGKKLSKMNSTKTWMAVAQNPYVDIIGHSGTPSYEYDYDMVIKEFGKRGKALEINEGTFSSRPTSAQNCYKIAEICKKYSVPIVVNSDAHFHYSVGKMPQAFKLLEEVDFPEELIVNRSFESINEFFESKVKKRVEFNLE